jgi:hypothetical protein
MHITAKHLFQMEEVLGDLQATFLLTHRESCETFPKLHMYAKLK